MGHLGVELDTENGVFLVTDGTERRILRRGYSLEPSGQGVQLVTVGHPHLRVVDALKERTFLVLHVQSGWTILSLVASAHALTVDPCQLLHTIANAQDGDIKLEYIVVHVRSVFSINGVRTARQDYTLGLPRQFADLLGAWQHLSVHVELSQPSGDEMGVLRAKIKHKNGVEHLRHFHGHVGHRHRSVDTECVGEF